MELEPLFQCNLACAGCGKIQHPTETLRKRLSLQQCFDAIEECGAPIISIAGGEPLIYEELPRLTEELVRRKKVVIVCTNALLLEKKIENFKPSPYFSWAVHIDGLRERLIEYYRLGARFAKWRAVIDIGPGIPSAFAVQANAHALARYAALCQESDIVPIVEPEVLMDGAHSLERCAEVTEAVLDSVFRQLF